ncbi:MAG: helix-turn-helix transcriptional regulator [Clostridia bacterium]|nr:helix-turn-helix transcriptional regulator [Clostridia bacterium]
MYIEYAKLWKLLIDKGMSKTDLLELTGISSRVLAKLSKNQTVTTDTIARICTALDCDVSDVMECVTEERLSVYGHYKKYGKTVEKTELYTTVQFTAGEQAYTVYVSNATAKRGTTIRCEKDQTVYWEQMQPNGPFPIRARSVLIKPKREKGRTTIILIKGKPSAISGLDEGIFVSSRGTRRRDGDVYVMSEAAFKVFVPKN